MLNRTEFKRKAPIAKPKPAKGPRKKRCKACRLEFLPDPPWHAHCSPDCGVALALTLLAKKKAKAQRQERAEDKVKLDGMKTIPQLKADAQKAFNEFIRLRDADLPCICCGKFATATALAQPGGAYDACHFRSRGSADHLRYNEDNVHRGLKDCNTWGHKDYRSGLIARIGLERVEVVESDQHLVKWTHDGLRALKAHYQQKIKTLKG